MSSVKKKRVGKYLVLLNEKLGQGSFAQVFRGVQQATGEPVAVKVADKKLIQEDQYTKNAFYSQIQIMKHLKSRNIIRFLDVHQTKNNYYIVQQLADGGTLRDLMKVQKRFSQADALRYFTQLLNGFGELVKNGIIHRDVKPQNILIKNNYLKIADFGFAKQSDNNSFMKTIVGTPLYMSPQILSSQQYTYKCDIWALGVILYELIVGRPPFQLKHKNMLQNIKSTEIVFPEGLQISDQVKELIYGCLAYKQQGRFDWEQVYLHPLFADKFKQNFTGDKEDSIKLAFIISGLRMAVHSQNIDMAKLLDKLPAQLKDVDFAAFIKLIDSSLTDSQIDLLFRSVLRKTNSDNKIVNRDRMTQYIKEIGIRMKSLNLAEIKKQSIDVEDKEEGQSTFLLVAKLKWQLDEKQTDIYQLYRVQDKAKTNALELEQFSRLVLKIDQSLTKSQIQILFKQFDLNKDGKISFNQFYRTICKIAGVVNVQK